MQAALLVPIVLALVLLLVAFVCLMYVRFYKPCVWNKLVNHSLLRWTGRKNEELQNLTATPTCRCDTPVQIVSTNVHDESRVIDVPQRDASTPGSDASSSADSTERVLAVSRKLSATALTLLKAGTTELLSDNESETKGHMCLVAQRSFGPYLTLGDAGETDHTGLSRTLSCTSVNSKQRRISTPVNVGDLLKVSMDTSPNSLSLSLSRATSAESFASDTATSELEMDLRAQKILIEFKIQYNEEGQTLVLSESSVSGLADVGRYALRLVLLPESRRESSDFLASSNGSLAFSDELRFLKVKLSSLDSSELLLRLVKQEQNGSETESGYAQFQLDFLFAVRLARLKFVMQQEDAVGAGAGELIISLSYLPTAQRVTTVSIKAKNLNTTSDVIVKSYLVESGKITSRKRTSPKPRSDLVTWTEVIIFRPDAGNFQNCQLCFVVATAEDHLRGDCTLGSVTVGPDSFGSGLIHWHHIVSSPRKPIAMSHRLVPR